MITPWWLPSRPSSSATSQDLYRSFYREVRSIVAASSPPERAALLLVHLVDWGGLGR